jgi:hypothetical protein
MSINTSKLLTRSLVGAMGLGIALLGMPESAKASPSCGPGANWVATCSPGTDTLLGTKAYLKYNISGQINNIVLQGSPVTITRESPVDSIVNDPDFAGIDIGFGEGNVGLTDQNLSVIKTQIEESFSGNVPGLGQITLTGKGNGAIVQATDFNLPNNPELAWSFFTVFAEVEGSFGKAKNIDPIVVEANQWLTGVSPQEIAPVDPPPPLPSSFFGLLNGTECNETDPLAAILYCGFGNLANNDPIPFYLVNNNGDFIDINGDPTTDPAQRVLFGSLVSEVHGVPPVPEPSTAAGLVLLGLGSLFGLKRKNK